MLPLLLLTLSARADDGSCGAWGAPVAAGDVASPELVELSGLASSRLYPGVLWGHGDSGDRAAVYALNSAGEDLGAFEVPSAENEDWEDIAVGPCVDEVGCTCLYIGDIGDNDRVRSLYALYRVAEPDPGLGGSTEAPAATWFVYPDGPHDAEALLVHPLTGETLVLTKEDDTARIYAFPQAPPAAAAAAAPATLSQVGALDLQALGVGGGGGLTAADVSPDGRRVVLRTDSALLLFEVPAGGGLLDALGGSAESIQAPDSALGEAVSFTEDGRALALGDEGSPARLWSVECLDFQAVDSPAPYPLVDCAPVAPDGGCGGCGGGLAPAGGGLLLAAIAAALSRRRV